LLADPDSTALEPLLQRLLLRRDEVTDKLWERSALASLRLRDVLTGP
jgi:membrane protein